MVVQTNCVGGMSLKDSARFDLATYRMLLHPRLNLKTPSELLHRRQTTNLLSLLNPIYNATHIPKSPFDTKTVFAVGSMVHVTTDQATSGFQKKYFTK